MGLWDFTKKAASTVWNNSLPGLVVNTIKDGPASALGDTIPGQLATGAYDAAYKKPADSVKAGYDAASAAERANGQNAANLYGQANANAQGYYSAASQMVNGSQPSSTYYNPNQPKFQSSVSPGAGSQYFGSGFQSAVSPGGGSQYFSGSPSFTQTGTSAPSFTPSTSNPSMSMPTYAQNYYTSGAAGAPNASQQQFASRQANGYGVDPLQTRYAARSSSPQQSNLDAQLGMIGSFATGGTATDQRMTDRQTMMAQPDLLDQRVQDRYAFAGQPTNTLGAMNSINAINPTQRTDSALSQTQGFDPSASARGQAGSIASGSTAGGQMLTDLKNQNTTGGQVMRGLQAGGGDSGQFLAGFDPNSTKGLQATYDKISALGATPEETFYNSQVAGDNPAYNQLKADFLKDQARSDAARGGFMSGRSNDVQQRGLTRLAADEFANRGNLAAAAGNARRAQLGLQNTAAENLDQNLLGRSTLQAQTGVSRDQMISQLAGQQDTNRASVANQQDTTSADLSKFQDSQGLAKMKQIGDLATSGDKSTLDAGSLRLNAAGQQDNLLRTDQNAIDALANTSTSRDLARQSALDSLATSSDTTKTARMNDYTGALSTSDVNAANRAKDIDALAAGASGSQLDRGKAIDALSQAASTEQGNNANRTQTAAQNASAEATANYQNKFNDAMKLGDAQSALQAAYDMNRIGTLTQSEKAAIGDQLAKAGVDAATIHAVIGDVLTVGGDVAKAYANA